MNFTEYFDWKILMFVAVVTSLFTEATKTFTPDWLKGKLALPIIAMVVTVLRIPFETANFMEWQTLGLNLIVTMSFAILFYTYLGEWTVTKLFGWLKSRLIQIFKAKDSDAGTN